MRSARPGHRDGGRPPTTDDPVATNTNAMPRSGAVPNQGPLRRRRTVDPEQDHGELGDPGDQSRANGDAAQSEGGFGEPTAGELTDGVVLGSGQWSADHSGYAHLQATAPQTIAFALADSPAGQLAWITEKFRDWTDPQAEPPEDAVSLDHLLTDVSIYWFTNTAAGSANLYRENRVATPAPRRRSPVPTAVAVFPTDIAVRPLLERHHTIVR